METSWSSFLNYGCQQKHVLSAHHFALDHLFSSFWKTTYASQIKFSRLAQVDDILAREGDILVYPGFTCQTSKSPITQGAPPTQWLVGQGESWNALSIPIGLSQWVGLSFCWWCKLGLGWGWCGSTCWTHLIARCRLGYRIHLPLSCKSCVH